VCRQRLEAIRKRHTALKEQLEGEAGQLDSLEAKVGSLCEALNAGGGGPLQEHLICPVVVILVDSQQLHTQGGSCQHACRLLYIGLR
jgi:hypothetical protein